jgi:magnesium chelatase family protein
VQRYRSRISGPLLDRIDLRIELPAPTLDELGNVSAAPTDATLSASALRTKLAAAAALQRARQGDRRNFELDAAELDRWAPLDDAARGLLARIVRQRGLSARAVQSLRRVARTLADLDGHEVTSAAQLARALALRSPIV